jgi:predicted Zn-dependent protease
MRLFICLIAAACFMVSLLVTADAQSPQRRSIERDRDQTSTGPGPQDRAERGSQTQRRQLLNQLFDSLAKAQNAEEATLYDSAISALFRQTGSPTSDLMLQYAREAIERREIGPALDYIDGLLAIAPDTLHAYYIRGTIMLSTGERGKALADMERVLRLEPRHYGAMSIAAGILRETGNRNAAFRMLEEAVKLHPHAPNGRRTLDLMRSQVEGRQT